MTLARTAIAMEMSSKGIQGDIDLGPRKARRLCMIVRRGVRKSSAAYSNPTQPFLYLIDVVSFQITFPVFNQLNTSTLTTNFCHV